MEDFLVYDFERSLLLLLLDLGAGFSTTCLWCSLLWIGLRESVDYRATTFLLSGCSYVNNVANPLPEEPREIYLLLPFTATTDVTLALPLTIVAD